MNRAQDRHRSVSLQLPQGDLFALPDAAGLQLKCREGALWITLDDDPRDVVLEAGQVYTGTEHRRMLVYALAPACLTIRAPFAAERAEARTPALLPLLGLAPA